VKVNLGDRDEMVAIQSYAQGEGDVHKGGVGTPTPAHTPEIQVNLRRR